MRKRRKELKNDPEKYEAMKKSEAKRSQKNRVAEREALSPNAKLANRTIKNKDM